MHAASGGDRDGDERRRRLAEARLYLILTVTDDAATWRTPLVEALQTGAIDVLQLRDQRRDERRVYFQAGSLQILCHAFGVLFLLNDRPDVAAKLDLDGAHVGQEDMGIDEARLLLGADRLLGLSTHHPGEVEAATRAGVDYAGLGPCFATSSKDLVREPGGADLIASCRAAAGDLPLFPIGGITTANIAQLVAAGATRAAVGAGILESEDPAAAARALREALMGA